MNEMVVASSFLKAFMDALHVVKYGGPVKVESFMKSLAERPVDEVLAEVSGQLCRAIS